MKGIVFTEFLEMVESQLGMEMADRIITAAALPNDGAYTAVGTYDHAELVRLVVALSEATGTPAASLVRGFGVYLFQRFSQIYPGFFTSASGSFEFLGHIENHIHVEVRKLYPEAELPTFFCERPAPDQLSLLYSSPRGFADLAEGLIQGCIAHFSESIALSRVDLADDGAEQRVQFHLVQQPR
ncbi:hypothetical protein FNU76_14045 [Chitinimonas arctica]|uniref:Heme NO-binding domain-containing protein n=1 Tax=Chitinimonas arctica TaxID=2594795 RepID=A0A516SH77_9NEIS|nr:heme NO-binding domain-containing protein [Chitinimonas arctica]QDQ27388.1 hypothetical protein FNU76_14045 [Chitinimonas arctica]